MAVILVAVVVSLFSFSGCQPSVPDTSQNLVSWKESVRESSSLAQVLNEYLADIETVEATASPCVLDHRSRLSRAHSLLNSQVNKCDQTSVQREAVERCLEDSTKTIVSDIRQQIVHLKTCVDKC